MSDPHSSICREPRTRSHDRPTEDFSRLLEGHRRPLERALRRRLQKEQRSLGRFGVGPRDIAATVADLCERGGKRVRPALVVVGARSIKTHVDPALLLDMGVVLELLHAYFLIHDDWMDGDLVRRGRPSVHAMLRRRFGSRRLGDSASILAGDWGVGVATKWMTELGLDDRRLRAALDAFGRMQLDAIVGQQRDLVAEDDDCELTYRLKTASYTVEGPLRLGAIAAGAKPSQLTAIGRFSLPVGVAFQHRDDLIGMFSDPSQSGKPMGSDLLSGKRTLLALSGLRLARGADLRLLHRVFGNPSASTADLSRAILILRDCGAEQKVEARIGQLLRRGLRALESAPLLKQGRTLMASAAVTLAMRTS